MNYNFIEPNEDIEIIKSPDNDVIFSTTYKFSSVFFTM